MRSGTMPEHHYKRTPGFPDLTVENTNQIEDMLHSLVRLHVEERRCERA